MYSYAFVNNFYQLAFHKREDQFESDCQKQRNKRNKKFITYTNTDNVRINYEIIYFIKIFCFLSIK